jgi:adenylate cyclase
MASRLQALNKEFGTSICIGPSAAGAVGGASLKQIANLRLRGTMTDIDVFTVVD